MLDLAPVSVIGLIIMIGYYRYTNIQVDSVYPAIGIKYEYALTSHILIGLVLTKG